MNASKTTTKFRSIEEIESDIAEAQKEQEELRHEWMNAGFPKEMRPALNEIYERVEALFSELAAARHWALKPGDGVHVRLWTDIHSCTVIRRTEKTVTIQRDRATHPAGSGAYSNEWVLEPDPEGYTETYRWSEKRQRFVRENRVLGIGREEYYDYEF